MIKQIFKEVLRVGRERLWMPVDAKIIHVAPTYVASDNEYHVGIWFEFELSEDCQCSAQGYEHREVLTFSTGHLIDYAQAGDGKTLEFKGTAVMPNHLVWHVYEVVPEPVVEPDPYDVKRMTKLVERLEQHPDEQIDPTEIVSLHTCNYCDQPAVGIYPSIETVSDPDGPADYHVKGPMKYMCAEHRETEADQED